MTIDGSGLTGGTGVVNYAVVTGDTLTSIAANLAAASTNTELQALGTSMRAQLSNHDSKIVSPPLATYTAGLAAVQQKTVTIRRHQ